MPPAAQVDGCTGKGFLPGQSANPSGKRKNSVSPACGRRAGINIRHRLGAACKALGLSHVTPHPLYRACWRANGWRQGRNSPFPG